MTLEKTANYLLAASAVLLAGCVALTAANLTLLHRLNQRVDRIEIRQDDQRKEFTGRQDQQYQHFDDQFKSIERIQKAYWDPLSRQYDALKNRVDLKHEEATNE